MVIEECAELIQAINKVKRSGLVSECVNKPNESMSISDILTYNNLCSEVADVKILIRQLELMLCEDRIQISFERKINRLEKGIKNHLENPK